MSWNCVKAAVDSQWDRLHFQAFNITESHFKVDINDSLLILIIIMIKKIALVSFDYWMRQRNSSLCSPEGVELLVSSSAWCLCLICDTQHPPPAHTLYIHLMKVNWINKVTVMTSSSQRPEDSRLLEKASDDEHKEMQRWEKKEPLKKKKGCITLIFVSSLSRDAELRLCDSSRDTRTCWHQYGTSA